MPLLSIPPFNYGRSPSIQGRRSLEMNFRGEGNKVETQGRRREGKRKTIPWKKATEEQNSKGRRRYLAFFCSFSSPGTVAFRERGPSDEGPIPPNPAKQPGGGIVVIHCCSPPPFSPGKSQNASLEGGNRRLFSSPFLTDLTDSSLLPSIPPPPSFTPIFA